MPQVAAHFVIADRLSAKLAAGAGNPAFVTANPEAYKLGAIGPDLSFYFLDSLPMREFFNTILQVYFAIQDIKELFEEVSDKIGGPAADFADWVTGGLSTDVAALVDRGVAAVKTAIEVSLLPGSSATVANPFAGANIPGIGNGPITVQATNLSAILLRFGHPYTNDPTIGPDGRPYRIPEVPAAGYANWWWMDVLHYRRTGLMAGALRDLAQDDFERAYAQGWLTHVAGDVCGHPYINGIVGGPYRNHVIRHLVLEKIVDTWVHDAFTGEDIVAAALQERCDVGAEFPRIARLLNRALDRTYINPSGPAAGLAAISPTLLRPGLPTEGDWQQAFDLQQRYLKLATDTEFLPPAPPPGSPAQFFAEVGGSIAGTAGSIGGAFSSSNSWWEWLLAPFLAALYSLVLLFKLVTLPAAILTRVLALAPRWLAYYMQLALYNYTRDLRWVLTLGGFGFPARADLTRPYAQASIRIPPSRTGRAAFRYPHVLVPRTVQGFWLHDPGPAGLNVPIEPSAGIPGVECSPYGPPTFVGDPRTGLPRDFIEGLPFEADAGRLAFLEQMATELLNVGVTFENQRETFMRTNPLFTGTQFGGAVELADRMLASPTFRGSWDLDGDQGYGYLSWEGPPPSYASVLPNERLTRR